MEALTIELITSAEVISSNNLESFSIGLKISNRSSYKQDFKLSGIQLFVNGIKSMAWGLALQNGTLSQITVHPGSEKIIQWNMGDALFQAAGNYELLLVAGTVTQTKNITVTN